MASLPAVPRLADIAVDGRTLLFTAALSIITGLLFGLLPALHGSRTNLNDVLKEGGRGAAKPRV